MNRPPPAGSGAYVYSADKTLGMLGNYREIQTVDDHNVHLVYNPEESEGNSSMIVGVLIMMVVLTLIALVLLIIIATMHMKSKSKETQKEGGSALEGGTAIPMSAREMG